MAEKKIKNKKKHERPAKVIFLRPAAMKNHKN